MDRKKSDGEKERKKSEKRERESETETNSGTVHRTLKIWLGFSIGYVHRIVVAECTYTGRTRRQREGEKGEDKGE